MKNSIFKCLSVLVMVFALTACGKMGTSNLASNQNGIVTGSGATAVPSNYTMSQFVWNMTGGSDIQFAVVPNGNNFQINVLRYQYQPRTNSSFILTSADSASAYNMLRNVFSGTNGFVSSSPSAYSGVYSTLQQVSTSGQTYNVTYPVLYYSSDNAGLSALFSVIGMHL